MHLGLTVLAENLGSFRNGETQDGHVARGEDRGLRPVQDHQRGDGDDGMIQTIA